MSPRLILRDPEELIDPRLTAYIGFPDPSTLHAIYDITTEAVADVIGAPVVEAISPTIPRVLFMLAPWAWDLSRGLHYNAYYSDANPSSMELLDSFSKTSIQTGLDREIANSIDMAVVLTMDQTVDHIHGLGATGRNPADLRDRTPWLDTCLLGTRLRVTLEMLRLMNLL